MKIRLFQNFVKKKDSTLQPTGEYVEKDVELKENTLVTNPMFRLTGFDQSYNYVYIPSWNRYYFVSNWKLINAANLYEITLTLDHLATFKTEIGSYTAFIERCADSSYFNSDLLDAALSCEDGTEVFDMATTTLFGNNNGGCYIVRLQGKGSTGITTFVFPSYTEIGMLFNPLFDNVASQSVLEAIDNFVKWFCFDPSRYLVAAYYSPLSYSYYSNVGATEIINLGWYETMQSALALKQSTHNFGPITINKPSNIYSDFRRTNNRFSSYTLYIPAIGTIDLSPDHIESTLTLRGSIDLLQGGIHYRLMAGNAEIASYEGNAYVNLSLGSSSTGNGSSQILSGAATLGAAAISGGSSLAVAGAGQVVSGVGEAIKTTPSVNGSSGGMAAIKYDPDILLSVTQKHSAQFPVSVYGRPCCKNLTISNLSGFIKCAKASVDIAGSEVDKMLVNDSLNNGFYYE